LGRKETFMYELRVTVKKVMGKCTATPPLKPGDGFTVSDGDIRIPDGGYICIWALQSLMPLITPKEREIVEKEDEDWMWRVHHAQCPDPDGRVIFEIERTGRVEKGPANSSEERVTTEKEGDSGSAISGEGLSDIRVVVESVGGKCTSRMEPGDSFVLRGGRLYIPPDRHFCLYALQAVLPLLPAKQRVVDGGDWMNEAERIICPDPAGNVILRIDREG